METRPTYNQLTAELSAAQFQLDMMVRVLQRIEGTLLAAHGFCPAPIQRAMAKHREEIESLKAWGGERVEGLR